MTTDTKEPVQLDALDRIGLEAQAGENEAQAAEDAILNPEQEPAIDPAITWAQIPKIFGGLVAMALPEVESAYNDAACLKWGGAMAAVSDKYGWDAGETMANWAPEIMLCMASLPLIAPTYQAIKARRAAAEKKPDHTEKKTIVLVDSQGRDMEPANPMDQEPGGFSVPT